jgi:hypothetical protein
LDEYVASLDLNHYWKNLVLGEIKTARALDDAGNVIYEVVYSQVIDNLVNNDGVSVAKQVVLPFPLDANDSTQIDSVYPNSLQNMRDQVIDVVGQISNVLPRWMLSRQANGSVLGFTPAWVIAYTNPGQSGQIAYNIQTQFVAQLNLVDFKVDRYELDNLLTKNWDRENQHWIPQPPSLTTFDILAHYQLPEPNDSSLIFTGGINYEVGDRIRILGSQIGGVDGVYDPDLDEYGNNVIITVEQVDEFGTIQQARAQGLAPLLTVGNTYYNIVGTNITGSGSGATWDLISTGADATVFDGNSLQFTAPVDMYNPTNEFDKYLVFPKRNILE